MKKIFILFTIFTSIAFGGSDKTIVKYDPNSWQNGHFLERTEWAKKVTQSENCKLSKEGKLYQIHSIGLNVMKEDPAIWLNGKYLEFFNSQCGLSGPYSLAGTKKSFEEKVDRYFYEKEHYNFFGDFMTILFWAIFIGFIAFGSRYYPRGLLYRNWFYRIK